ncbi:MAG: hypothetical protein U5L96_10275 [Owenweeksia sp.]|nr:hypothetical protein [Owenweeksia sp.]
MAQKTMLLILDGWGIAQDPSVSAIDQAHTPFMDDCRRKYPHSQLSTERHGGRLARWPNG